MGGARPEPDAGQRAELGLQVRAQLVLVRLERGHRGDQALAAAAVDGGQAGEEVDCRGGAGHQLVGQGAELEPLRDVVGRRQQLAGERVSSSDGAAASTPQCGPRNL